MSNIIQYNLPLNQLPSSIRIGYYLLFILLLTRPCVLSAQLDVPGLEHPYGITQKGKDIFVSNIGTNFHPLKKDGDGFITLLSADGEILELNAFPDLRLNAPKGLAVLNNFLYVADIDEITIINLKTKALEQAISLRSFSSDLRDLSVLFSSKLGVIATDKHFLIEVSPFEKSWAKVGSELPVPGVQSLVFDSLTKTAYVSGYSDSVQDGEVGKIDLISGKYMKLSDLSQPNRGLLLQGNNLIFASWSMNDQRAVLQSLHVQYKKTKTIPFAEIDPPADLIYEPTKKKIWMTCPEENRLVLYDWSSR